MLPATVVLRVCNYQTLPHRKYISVQLQLQSLHDIHSQSLSESVRRKSLSQVSWYPSPLGCLLDIEPVSVLQRTRKPMILNCRNCNAESSSSINQKRRQNSNNQEALITNCCKDISAFYTIICRHKISKGSTQICTNCYFTRYLQPLHRHTHVTYHTNLWGKMLLLHPPQNSVQRAPPTPQWSGLRNNTRVCNHDHVYNWCS